MEIKTISQLEKVIKLLKREKVDIFELNGLKLVITKHDYQQTFTAKTGEKPKTKMEEEDDILFNSF